MDFLINKNEHFKIEHCYSCLVPGYLVVSPTIRARSINDLPEAFQRQLGPNLVTATEVIKDVINPLEVYCAQFGEEGKDLHFHIFPRTLEITSEYLKAYPDQKELIHGPILLDWARLKYKEDREKIWSVVSPVIEAMRKRMITSSSTPAFQAD